LSERKPSLKSKLTNGTTITYATPKTNELENAFNLIRDVNSSSILFFVKASRSNETKNPVFEIVFTISLSTGITFEIVKTMNKTLSINIPKATFLKWTGSKRKS